MIDELFATSKKEDIEQQELFRALNELVHRVMDRSLRGDQMDEFFLFARRSNELKLLGFYLRNQQRMIDAGCDQVSAYHWAYNDVLETTSKTQDQVFG